MAAEAGIGAIQWAQVGVALVAGGAMGAFINAAFAWRRDRLQPIRLRSEEVSLFDSEAVGTNLVLKATEPDGWTSEFDNMRIVELLLVNDGSKDFAKFTFGVTLPRGDVAVRVVGEGPDRHHKVEMPAVDWRSTTGEIDFSLAPFNRKDAYTIRIFAFSPLLPRLGGEVTVSSAEPVKFVRQSASSALAFAAEVIPLIGLGPLSVSLSTRGR
jgi:hypothetical protein